MKIRNISFLLAAAVLAFGSCKEDTIVPVQTPAVDSSSITPAANESGSTRAYAGTEVSVTGFNLDKVGRVTVEDVDAEIISQDIQTLTFAVPELPAETFPQRDNPYPVTLRIYDSDCETVVFNYPYYVTVPVTDAIFESFSPATGTVGDMITIEGRNLDQITKVVFNGVEVGNSSFGEESSEDAILVPVPGGIETSGASTSVTITAEWGGGKVLDITSETSTFSLLVPVFDAFTPDSEYELGDELTLTGENLDLVTEMKWGEYNLSIKEDAQTAESLTFGIPTNIPTSDPVNVTDALVAGYGVPVQNITVLEEMTVNTTAKGPAEPVYTETAPAEGYNNIYLRHEVTVKGENMASIEKFRLTSEDGDNVEAEVTSVDDYSAKFIVPDNISGTAAKEMTLTAIWNGGNETEFGKITVYPFYYTKGLQLGVGQAASTSDFAMEHSFLLLNEGRVISAQEWLDTPVDKYAATESKDDDIVTAKNKLNAGATAEQYYAVSPYTFMTVSGGSVTFQGPAQSGSQIKNMGSIIDSGIYGTPIILFNSLVDADYTEFADQVKKGEVTDINALEDLKAGTSAPGLSTGANDKTKFELGSVLTIQYGTFAVGSDGKINSRDEVRQIGWIYITAIDDVTGDEAGDNPTVTFDLYWSNPLN